MTAASPDGPELVSVGSFRIAREVTPALWAVAVQELNDVAARLAERIAPTASVEAQRDASVAGHRARVYEIAHRREGAEHVDRVTFVLVGTRQFQLTCRIAVADPEPGETACAELVGSFQPER